jgi:hypothetical protein
VSAPVTSVTLDELDRKGQLAEMDTAKAAALAGTELVEVRPAPHGQWRLLPRGNVGAVRVDDLQVQVKPKDKVGLDRLLFLFCGDPVRPCPWFVAPCLPAGLRPGLQHHVELVPGYPADVAVPGFSQHGAQL